MEEFLKLRWRVKDVSVLESQTCFMTPEVIRGSFVYRQFNEDMSYAARRKGEFQPKIVIPGLPLASPWKQVSCLDKWQQERCLKAMKTLQSGKDPLNYNLQERNSLKIFKDLQSKIVEENKKYLESVTKVWAEGSKNALNIKPVLYKYAKKHFENKFKKFFDYPQFYKETDTLNMIYDEKEAEVEVTCIQNVLEVGTLARFASPNIRAKCVLKIGGLPKQKRSNLNSKLPVSEDKNIDDIVKNYNVDVVISSGGLKKLLDVTSQKENWIIPLELKMVKYRTENGTEATKKVIFIDNPFTKHNPNVLDLSYYCHKMIIRTTFCHYEAFQFPGMDIPLEVESEISNKLTELEKKFDEAEVKDPSRLKSEENKRLFHNATYRIWNIKKKSLLGTLAKHRIKNTEINLLVRSKLDGCEKNEKEALQSVIVRPKLEFQLQYGASIPSKTELSREWTSLFFRPFSNLYRVRLHNPKSEVVAVEKCTLQKVNSEAMALYDFKPVTSLGVLQQLLELLMSKIVREGHYILKHQESNGTFVALLEESDSEIGSYNLHEEYNKCKVVNCENISPNPIDVTYILPSHEIAGQVPGMFKPFIRRKKGSGKNKKKILKQAAKKMKNDASMKTMDEEKETSIS